MSLEKLYNGTLNQEFTPKSQPISLEEDPIHNFKAGDIVIWDDGGSGKKYIITGGHVLGKLVEEHGAVPPGYLRMTDGSNTWTRQWKYLTKVGSLNE